MFRKEAKTRTNEQPHKKEAERRRKQKENNKCLEGWKC